MARQGSAESRMLALGRLRIGELNKTEAVYAERLRALEASGQVLWHKFEGLKLRLADNTFYTPDFAVMAADGVMRVPRSEGPLAGRCQGQDQDRRGHVPVSLHCGEGQAQAGRRRLGSGGVLMDERIDRLVMVIEQQGKQIAELAMHVGLLVQAVAQMLGEEAGSPVRDEGAEPERVDLDGKPY